MLKILSEIWNPIRSNCSEKEVKMGFLRQDIDFEQGRTVLEEATWSIVETKL
jgi:ATP-binding cassette subfamily F protein 3